ncbi:hypothetical protein [Microbacterium sp. 3J1]|uniref:hypothetical protein n=1 Tax=Microbacterium sp. 3J1 TaxID=861269 RepID=UPI000A7DDD6D|nr:hypothetical protein [Microbacterium sp. 3J1]
MRPVAAVVLVAVALAWLLLTVLDLRENDGIAPLVAMFGIPALASAIVIQLVITRSTERRHLPRPVLWWMLAVLPAGILAAFVVAIKRDPEYFIGDDGPWMLIWVPIFIVVGVLLGALVWFFFVFPLVNLVTAIGRIARGEASAGIVMMPLVLLAVGVLCVIGGLSVDTDGSGRASWGAIIASFFGIPGAYEVIWEPGLWIVRAIVAAIVLVFAVPAVAERIRSR